MIFVVNQSHAASAQQVQKVEALGGGGAEQVPAANTQSGAVQKSASQANRFESTVNKAASFLESPFSGLTSSWRSQWKIQIITTLLALLLYGIVLRYVSRMVHVRA